MIKEELEKEAIEYAEKINLQNVNISGVVRNHISQAYQQGAEFGYNKCFEQIRKLVNEDTRLDCIIPELLRLKERE